MKFKRLWHTMRLYLLPNNQKRAEYIRKHKLFACFGKHSFLQNKVVPLYSNLIRIHNNVNVGKKVEFVTHDVVYAVINNMQDEFKVTEKVGCIDVRDNVFIGACSTILYGVSIGPNAIVAAGSVVTKDVPPNSVVAGVPARVIGTFDQVVEKARHADLYPAELKPRNQRASDELCRYMWEKFDKEHSASK